MIRNAAEALNLHLPSYNQLRAGALAVGAVFSLHANQPPGQQQEEQLERGTPSIIQNYIDSNSVVINALRCSGDLIRNSQGVPVGALTAAHCVDSPDEGKLNPLVKGGDGNTYMVSSTPVTLETGIDSTNLQPVGTVQEFVVPPKLSITDQALAVLPGHSPQEVMSDYKQEQLSQQEIRRLPFNKTTIWLSGYPYTQKGDSTGNMIRQEFPTTYIAETFSNASFGITENVLTATAKTDSNGATCSWGNSGGEGLVTQVIRLANGSKRQVVRSVGNFSTFATFEPLQEKGGSLQSYTRADAKSFRQQYRQEFPKIQWHGVSAVCNYAYSTIGKNYQVIQVASSLSSVPPPATPLR